MKFKLLLTFLLLTQIVLAQSEKLTKVKGTKCSLIPPAGFVTASNFSGFQHNETGSSIMVNELPAPYQTMADGFTADALKTRGMTLLSKTEIEFNRSKATLIKVTQPANGISYLKQMLIFGDSRSTVLVNGIYPEAAKEIEGKIKDALLSTVYDVSQNEDPLDAVTFKIDPKDTDFKLVRYMSGMLLYSTDGNIPTEKPTLIVGNSLSKISTQDQKKYAEERLKKLPGGEFIVIKASRELTIDNLRGYEIIANGKTKDNKPELVYQVMLFNDQGDYYIILGQAKEDFDTYLASFKKVAFTFKRK